MPRLSNPRDFLGYSGQPLAVAEDAMPLPDRIKKRFDDAGQGAFTPYINPWETLSRANDYRMAGHAADIADAEDSFINEVGSGKTGLQEFTEKNPIIEFSPMWQTYKQLHQTKSDPYEVSLAREGSQHLGAYRAGVAAGIDPLTAYSQVRDHIIQDKEAKQKHADDELNFVKEGGDIEDFPAVKDLSPGARLDFIKKKGRPASDIEVSKHEALKDALNSATQTVETPGAANDKAKKEAFALAFPDETFDKDNPAHWTRGYDALKKQTLEPAQKAYDSFVSGLHNQGKRLPGEQGFRTAGAIAALPSAAPAVVPEATTDSGVAVAPASPAEAAPPAQDIETPDAAPAPIAAATRPAAGETQSLADLRRQEDELSSATGFKRLELLKKQEDTNNTALKQQEATATAKADAEKKARMDALHAEDKGKMKQAMDTMLSGITDLRFVRDPTMPDGQLAFHAGLQPRDVAFVQKNGQPVTWNTVETVLRQSSGFKNFRQTGKVSPSEVASAAKPPEGTPQAHFDAAIEILKKDPSSAPFFDKRFGAGAAAKILDESQ